MSTLPPKVSIIIPVYNSARYLRECLDSAVMQTLREIEIICIDDGSTDDSLKILQEYASKDNRIIILTQQHQYAGVARNRGVDIAKGEYLSFLDSDDAFARNMLQEMYFSAKRENADVVVCNAMAISEGRAICGRFVHAEYLKKPFFSCSDPDFANYVFQCILGHPWNKLIRSSLVKAYNFRFSATQHHNDTAFSMACVVAADKILYVPEFLVYWRVREDSLCHAAKHLNCMRESVEDTYAAISKLSNYPLIERSFINYVVCFSLNYYEYHLPDEQPQILPDVVALSEKFRIKNYPDSYFYDKERLKRYKKLVGI